MANGKNTTYTVTGASAGAVAGPIGAGIGAVAGLIVGSNGFGLFGSHKKKPAPPPRPKWYQGPAIMLVPLAVVGVFIAVHHHRK